MYKRLERVSRLCISKGIPLGKVESYKCLKKEILNAEHRIAKEKYFVVQYSFAQAFLQKFDVK